jgi:hypothetical protein
MPDDPTRTPSSAENAMAANAASRDRQEKRVDRTRRDLQRGATSETPSEQSLGQLEHSIRSAFDRSGKQAGDGLELAAEIKAARQRSAELLCDAADLVAERTNDS